MTPFLALSNITVAFGGVVALSGLSLEVPRGTIHGVIGPNGSGKSTLFNVITRFVRPETGTLTFEQEDLLARRPDQLAGLGIARTFQAAQLFPGMTVLENVMTGLHVHTAGGVLSAGLGLPVVRRAEAAARAKALETLAFAKMEAFADRAAGELSYGQQRLVEVARALVAGPRLLLLDEPAAGLSLPRIADLRDVLGRIRTERGVTILLIEHVIRLVLGISDRVTVLNSGQKIAEGLPDDIRQDPAVIEAYLGREGVVARA